jgi:hypothetical protein
MGNLVFFSAAAHGGYLFASSSADLTGGGTGLLSEPALFIFFGVGGRTTIASGGVSTAVAWFPATSSCRSAVWGVPLGPSMGERLGRSDFSTVRSVRLPGVLRAPVDAEAKHVVERHPSLRPAEHVRRSSPLSRTDQIGPISEIRRPHLVEVTDPPALEFDQGRR